MSRPRKLLQREPGARLSMSRHKENPFLLNGCNFKYVVSNMEPISVSAHNISQASYASVKAAVTKQLL